jgi:hypothetical protein
VREIERSKTAAAQQDAPRWPEEVLGQTVSGIRQWPDKPVPPWGPALLLPESCCWLPTSASRGRVSNTHARRPDLCIRPWRRGPVPGLAGGARSQHLAPGARSGGEI